MEIGSPEWWLVRELKRLSDRRPHVEKLAAYYDGLHDLRFASKKFQKAFGGLFDSFADNWCALVVDAVEERLNVDGFRVSPELEEADADAWGIWQRNSMDAQAQLTHIDAILTGESYVSVWFDAEGRSEIASESARNVIVDYDPRFIHRRRAGLRIYEDDWGYTHAELFLPDGVYLFKTKRSNEPLLGADHDSHLNWQIDPLHDGYMANPLGVVPIIAFANRPRRTMTESLGLTAQSEIAQVIPIQDGVNKLVADMLVSAEAAAYRQRYVTGFDPEVDAETGAVIPPDFTPDKSLFIAQDPDTRFGEFQATDLRNYVQAIEMFVTQIASITRTPPHYLNASADRLSGESIKAAETGLVAKCKRKMRHFGESWEEVIRLAGQIEGKTVLAAADQAETIWGDPESRTESVHVDAVLKQQALGVPQAVLWEALGYSPAQIARMKALKTEEAFTALLSGTPAGPAATTEPIVEENADDTGR